MKIEVLPHYGHSSKASPYTHRCIGEVHSLGTFYGKYNVPGLYVIFDFYYDKKTGKPSDDIHFTWRPNGPNDAILNFPHSEVKGKWINDNQFKFTVLLHALYNNETKVTEKYTGNGKLGVNIKKIVTVEGGGSYERTYESKDTSVTLNVQYNGVAYAKQGVIKIGGHLGT